MNNRFHRLSLLAVVIVSTGLLLACNQIKDPIQVEGGLISGTTGSDPSIKVYKGIPFAAPPVGDLRWKAPQPVVPWEGVRAADELPDACIQNLVRTHLPNGPWTEELMHQGEASEDCLYLNLWTGATSPDEKRPVMVYIYGGSFNEGSNAIASYDGEELAKKGVVQVGINYRVGALGFLSHPELTAESEHHSSGNYGLLDQFAALQWVKNNIAAFGGDPDNVTIFGQSAGAMSVAMLMQSPLANGLFHRAIIQSDPSIYLARALGDGTPLSQGEEAGIRNAEAKGASTLADLRALTPEQLLAGPNTGRMGPILDGWFRSADNLNTTQVPVMNGFTADDLGSLGFGPRTEATVAAYENEARQQYGEKAETYLSLYPAASDADVPSLRKVSGQDRSRVSLSLWASEQASMSGQVYTYYFNRAIPWPEYPQFGAFHTGEVPYVFNNLKMMDRPWEAVDHTVADQVSSYWVNFAKTGDPNGAGLPAWTPFSSSEAATMKLGAQMSAMPIAAPAKVAFWKENLTAPTAQ